MGIGTCKDTEIVIPANIDGYEVTAIGYYAFYVCKSIESVTIPDTVTSIGPRAFFFCASLKSVVIPDGVEEIVESFLYCTSLTSIVIPDSVKTIAKSFQGCSSLTSVTISIGATGIGTNTFSGCPLTELNYTGTIEELEKVYL